MFRENIEKVISFLLLPYAKKIMSTLLIWFVVVQIKVSMLKTPELCHKGMADLKNRKFIYSHLTLKSYEIK